MRWYSDSSIRKRLNVPLIPAMIAKFCCADDIHSGFWYSAQHIGKVVRYDEYSPWISPWFLHRHNISERDLKIFPYGR